MQLKVTSKWDSSLDIDIDWKVNTLKTYISRSIQQKFSHTTGALARSIDIRTYSQTYQLMVSSDAPYARIHEEGGTVPERYPRNAKVLRFMVGSVEVFARHAKAFKLPAKDYVEDAINKWYKKIEVKWKGER